MSWIYQTENKIYTIIKKRTTKKLGSTYKDLFFTMDGEPSDTTNHFPTVYLHFMPSAEYGSTLDGLDINAVMSTIQIEVTSSKTQGQNVAREVMWETIDQLKKLRYQMFLSPEVINTGNDTNRVVARMRRLIGANDTIE